jgi:hypothetical protein
MDRKVVASMSSPMALRVVVTVWGDSGWQDDWREMGSAGDETRETLGTEAGSSVDKLMLDIVGVIVVLAEDVITEILVLERMGVHRMAAMAGFEFVKFVSGVRRVADKTGEVEWGQLG